VPHYIKVTLLANIVVFMRKKDGFDFQTILPYNNISVAGLPA